MSSFDSAKGPSMTVRLPPETTTRAPFELGLRPSAARSTPAFAISSLYFMYAAKTLSDMGFSSSSFVSFLLGPEVIMNRIVESPLGSEPDTWPVSTVWGPCSTVTSNNERRDRHGGRSFFRQREVAVVPVV